MIIRPWLATVFGILVAGGAVAQSDLSVLPLVDPQPIVLGEPVTITAEAMNNGPADAMSVEVIIDIPPGFTLIEFDDGGTETPGVSISWTVAQLANGEIQSFSATFDAGYQSGTGTSQPIAAATDAMTAQPSLFFMTPQESFAFPIVGFPAAVDLGGTDRRAGPSFVADRGAPELSSGMMDLNDGVIFDDLGNAVAQANLLVNPVAVLVKDDGMLYVADQNGFRSMAKGVPDTSGRVLLIDPTSGDQTIVAEGDELFEPSALAFDAAGQLLVADGNGKLIRVDNGGDQAVLTSGNFISDPVGLDVAQNGDIILLDRVNGIVEIDADTFAQSQLAALMTVPAFDQPAGIGVSLSGLIYVSSQASPGHMLVFDPDLPGFTATLAGDMHGFSDPRGVHVDDLVRTRVSVDFGGTDPELMNNLFDLDSEIIRPLNQLPAPIIISVMESIGLADSGDPVPAPQVTIVESVGVGDSANPAVAQQIAVSEGIGIASSATPSPATLIAVRESLRLKAGPQLSSSTPSAPVILGLGPIERLCEGEPQIITDAPITRFEGVFDQDMLAGSGDNSSVDDLINYQLGSNRGCDDEPDPLLATARWVADERRLELAFTDDQLAAGDYRFTACDRIVSANQASLDGDGDGEAGGAYRKRFRMVGDSTLRNPNFDQTITPWLTEGSLIEDDAAGLAGSGALMLAGGQFAEQCVALGDAPGFVRTSLAVRAETASRFDVDLGFFSDSDCNAEIATDLTTLAIPNGGAWNRVFTDQPRRDGATHARLTIRPDGDMAIDSVALYLADSPFASSYEASECGLDLRPGTEL